MSIVGMGGGYMPGSNTVVGGPSLSNPGYAQGGGGWSSAFSGGGMGIGSIGLPNQQQLYSQILQGYQGLQGQVLGQLGAVQGAAASQMQRFADQSQGSAYMKAINAGLGSSSAAGAMLRGAQAETNYGVGQLAGQMAPMFANAVMQTGQAPLNMMDNILMARLNSVGGQGSGGYGAGAQPAPQARAPQPPPSAPQIGPRTNMGNPADSGASGWTNFGGAGGGGYTGTVDTGAGGGGQWFQQNRYQQELQNNPNAYNTEDDLDTRNINSLSTWYPELEGQAVQGAYGGAFGGGGGD